LAVDDWETRLERGVKTGGADEYVDRVLLAVVATAALLGDFCDLTVYHTDVFFAERFEVVDTWCETPASDSKVWDELLLEELVL